VRDAALRALLTTEADRAEFDARVAELQRQEAQARPMSGTAPVVLRVSTTPIAGGTLEIVYRGDGMSDQAMEAAAWQIVRAFRADAELMGLRRIATIADVLERREEFATYSRSVLRTFGRQPDRSWAALPAV